MSDVAVRVTGLCKRYEIARPGAARYATLRESLGGGARRLAARLMGRRDHALEAFEALRDVGFELKAGSRVGIVGRNGAGKSTLLRCLSRITEPSAGRIELHGRVASLLEVGTGFHPELTGRENVFLNGAILGMSRAELRRKLDAIVAFAEIGPFLDTPVKRYSSGMYVRLAFSIAAHLEPDILLVDEVLAVGDAQFQAKCLGKLEDVSHEGRTVLFVSHNMGALQALCTDGLLLEDGALTAHGEIGAIAGRYLRTLTRHAARDLHPAVRHLSVAQVGATLELEFRYALDVPFRVPNFGFVIQDERGAPVTGTNVIKSGVREFGTPAREGTIRVVLRSPKLVDGTYTLSAWFDDGFSDFVHLPSCLAFDVMNMGLCAGKNAAREGAAIPECDWRFLPEGERGEGSTP